MLLPIVVIFIIGYLLIALEHQIRIDKAATALLLGMILWTLYTIGAPYIIPLNDAIPKSRSCNVFFVSIWRFVPMR